MNVKLTLFHFTELQRNGFNLDMIFLLKLAEEGHDLVSLCEGNAKLEIICQGVYRKGLISQDHKITRIGKNVLEFLKQEAPKDKIVKNKSVNEDFEKWWKAYPGTDTFEYKGKKFAGSRSLRSDKENCKTRFNSIIVEGEYSVDDLIAALEFDITQKKENSLKTGMNKLSFMQNSYTYLNQRSFEPFIELVKEGVKIIESSNLTGGTDI
jgi:hypothetical protein